MTRFGGLDVPDCLLAREHATDLLSTYLGHDERGHLYSGAAFDTYPGPNAPNSITDSDLVALAMLRIRVTGHEALNITQYHREEIHRLLSLIPTNVAIEDDAAGPLLGPKEPVWKLWELLRDVKDRTKRERLGAVAAGKLLALKRPNLIPIADSSTKAVFKRPYPSADVSWWDDVRDAARDPKPVVEGMTLWQYLGDLRAVPGAGHLPVLRVLDILAWMHVEKCKTPSCPSLP